MESFGLNLGETVHFLSIYKRERKSERCDREARGGPHPLPSQVFRLALASGSLAFRVFSRIQRSNKNTRKIEGSEQSQGDITRADF